jgi:glycosyltransferase involved in cell wall biosynthesis
MSMRVTIVSRIYRPEPAAASIYLGAVADELLAQGHVVDVITSTPPPGLTDEVSGGERVSTFPVLRDANGYVRGYVPYMSFDLPLAFRLMFTRRPDVVLMEPPPTTGVIVRAVCALRRIPYVYDAADVWSDAAQLEPVAPFVITVLRGLEKFALRGAAHVVTISQGVIDRVRALGVTRPITLTGFGADTRDFSVVDAPAAPLFVYAGSYSPSHGAEILVDAFARFLPSHPDYVLRFIGNGSERPLVQDRAAALGVSDRIEYLDPVPPAELLPHLGAATATLATIKPSTVYDYSYASKAFSSLAAGCPVLFAGPGPTGDLIDVANTHVRAGITCAYEVDAIAAAMTEFADNRSTPAQRAALGAWTAEEHSMAAVARRVVAVLVSVVAGRG